MRPVHRHALRLVDRRGIAVIDVRIVLGVEGDAAAIVGAHGHALRAHLLDGAQRAILDAKAALVAQEHDAVAAGELTLAALGRDRARRRPDRQPRTHLSARGVIEFAHLVIGVGEDDARIAGAGLPVAIPALDQIAARCLPRLGNMHHAVFVIGLNRIAGAPGGQMPGGVLLPAFMLAAHLADFDAAMAFVDRTERRARFDGLQLLRIADQHNFAPASAAWDSTRSIWRVPTMPASSMTSTSREVSMSRPLPHCSMLAMVRDAMPEPLSSPSAAMPDSAAPRTS
jgi:hypothetical protein